ncbi:MAG TPA: glycosyltransferase family 4 protein [Pyrinomonadaceae bacterium]|nr:glycosyltransferase family 4 protein [Pyrinomonadaceae bacterium]
MTRKLHVVHLIEDLGPGGAERLLYTNLKHFDPERIRSTVITVYSRANRWLEPITALGVPVVSLNCGTTRDIPKGIRTLRAWLRTNRVDLIHSHLWAANIIGRIAGRLTSTPVISSVHNPDHEPQAWADGADVSLIKRRLVRALDRWTAHAGNDRLIAVSEYVRQSACRDLRFSADSVELVYNPFDVDLMDTPVGRNRAELFRLPADSLILLNVARVAPQKGLLYALRALPAILRQYQQVHLISVGSTSDARWTAELKREAEALGVADHFHLLGSQPNVVDFLRACDIFVFPSLYEGLGIALIEAMAAGCVCVATNTGPIPEVVQDGKDGVLVPAADAEALARAICDLLGDPARRSQLGTAAKQTAFSKFQPKEQAERLTRVYESVIHRLHR